MVNTTQQSVIFQNVRTLNRPSFFTIQLFDGWMADFKKDDHLVNLADFDGDAKKLSCTPPAVLAANYPGDQINSFLAPSSGFTCCPGSAQLVTRLIYQF